MSKTFCPIPWDHISVRANGDLRVCCQCVYGDQAVLKNEKGVIYNGHNETVESARNAPIAKDIRKSMLNGEQPDACKLCWDEEKIGVNSKRMHANNMGLITLDEAKNITTETGEITTPEKPIAYYDLRFGNKCNLKCRSCGPADSSQWYDDWVGWTNKTEFGDDGIGYTKLAQDKNGKWVTINDTFDWYEDSRFMDELINNIDHVKRIYFTGGEPTIIHQHMEVLKKCIETDTAKNIHLEYNSNMAKLPQSLIEKWGEFKRVDIGCSIDGIGPVAEYLRHPCKWDIVYNNLMSLENVKKGEIYGSLTATIGLYNFLHFADMIEWQLSHNFKRLRDLPSPHLLRGPVRMTIQVLPPKLKLIIEERYDRLYKWIGENHNEALRRRTKLMIDPYMTFMNEKDDSARLPEFWKATTKIDELRNENFEKTFPELYLYIKDYI